MSPVGTAEPPTMGEAPAQARWVRPFLAVVAALSLLLFGAAGGLLYGTRGAEAVPVAGSVDVGFAQDMTVHHTQAVEMASWERDHTTDPELAQLASDIEATQTSQVGRMQGWLELWGAGSLPVGGHMAWMGVGAVDTMPGMASSAELAALRASSGPTLDVTFLQLMLRHHQGGAEMLSYGAEHAEVAQVRNLAAQMLSSQTSESEYLRQLLTRRGGTPLPG